MPSLNDFKWIGLKFFCSNDSEFVLDKWSKYSSIIIFHYTFNTDSLADLDLNLNPLDPILYQKLRAGIWRS